MARPPTWGPGAWKSKTYCRRFGRVRAQGRKPTEVDVTPSAITDAEATALEAAERLRARDYTLDPGKKCRSCEVRTVCGSAAR